MRLAWTVVLAIVASCGASPVTPASPTPPSRPMIPPAFPAMASADLVVVLADGDLAAYAIAGDVLTELGRAHVGAKPDVSDMPDLGSTVWWLDRDHLLVGDHHDASLWTPAGRIALAVPADAVFDAIARPTAENDLELTRGDESLLIHAGGQVFWAHCAWGYPVDGFQCTTYGRVRLWPPDPTVRVETWNPDRTPDDRPPAQWTDAAPAFTLDTTGDKAPTCQDGGRTVALASPADPEAQFYAIHWLPTKPAAAIVEYGVPGMAALLPTGFAVFDRCTDKPILVGTGYQLFSDGLWLSDDTVPGPGNVAPRNITHVRRGLRVLGELPGRRGFAIRPR
jgi:hypothetical protein